MIRENWRGKSLKHKKTLIQSEKGAVSIFLILIVVAIFFFNAVLIDFVRVMAANKQTEIALKTAVRSTLSSYNTKLQENYGLFGAQERETREVYVDVLNKNLTRSSGYYQFINPQIVTDQTFIEFNRSLADQNIFNQQILEEMKYKAPIDFTLEVVDKFSPLADALKETSRTTKLLKDLNTLNKERENHLNRMLQGQEAAYTKLQDEFGPLVNPSYMTSNYSQYIANYQAYQEEEDPIVKLQLSHSISEYRLQSQGILHTLFDLLEKQQIELVKANEQLEQAKQTNQEMKARVEQARQEGEQYDIVKQNSARTTASASNARSQESLRAVQQVQESVDQLIYDEAFFMQLKTGLEEQEQALKGLQLELQTFRNQFNTSLTIDNTSSLQFAIESLQAKHSHYLSTVSGIIDNQKKIIAGKQADAKQEQEKKENEKRAQSTLTEIMDLYEKMKRLESKANEYKQVGAYVQQYDDLQEGLEGVKKILEDSTDPEEVAEKAMEEMDSLFSEMADLLMQARDRIYINEFAVSKFTHMDPMVLSSLLHSPDFNQIESLLDINNQQIEYILYGLETPGANISAAFAEIFAMRLAINSMEAYKTCIGTGNPLAILICVLATALTETLQDIKQLIETGIIQFCEWLPIELNYKDHLRFFMLLHGTEKRISRMQALIHFQHNLNLIEAQTYVKGRATTTINLWFLPGVMKALSYTGIIDGSIEGRNYIITKTAVWSY